MLGAAILLLAAALALVTGRRSNSARTGWFALMVGAAYLWLIFHEAIASGSEPALQSVIISTCLPVVLFIFVARDRDYVDRTIRLLAGAVVAVALLSVVSLASGLLVGLGSTHLANLPLGYLDRNVGLLLPGGFTYGGTLNSGLPRMLGLGREPGMGAIFYVWAFFAIPMDWRRRNLVRWLILFPALLSTQSTAGVAFFTIALALYAIIGQGRLRPFATSLVIVASIAVAYVAIYDQTFGVLAKLETTSYDERNVATIRGLDAMANNFWDSSTTLPLSNVNLIAGGAAHGGPWVFIVGLLLVLTIVRSGRRNPLTYAAIFIAGTALTSQPIHDTPGTFLLLYLCIASHTELGLAKYRRSTVIRHDAMTGSSPPEATSGLRARKPASVAFTI